MYFGGALDAIGDVFGGVMDALNPFGMIGDLVGDVLGGVAGGLGGAVSGIFDTATGIVDSFMPGNLIGGIADFAGNLFGAPTGVAPQISIMPPFPTTIPMLPEKGEKGDIETLMAALAGKCDNMYASLESSINGLGESPSQEDLQKIQLAMSKYNQMVELLSNVQKDLHEMSMSIIRNIKG